MNLELYKCIEECIGICNRLINKNEYDAEQIARGVKGDLLGAYEEASRVSTEMLKKMRAKMYILLQDAMNSEQI